MNTAGIISKHVCEELRATQLDELLAVPTQCLYPTNRVVVVYVVRSTEDRFVVSDRGEALDFVYSCSGELGVKKWAKTISAYYDLSLKNSIISTPQVNIDQLPTAISFVANAVTRIAQKGFSETQGKTKGQTLRLQLSDRILEKYGRASVAKNVRLTGASNRTYSFDYVVNLRKDKRAIIDTVSPHGQSVNSKLASHYDLKRLDDPSSLQFLVFDRQQKWQSSDLNLLESVAHLVPIRQVQERLPIAEFG